VISGGFDFAVQEGIVVLLLASSLDYLIGDPWGWPHPVRIMGWLINLYSQFVFTLSARLSNPETKGLAERMAGMFLAIGLIGGSGCVGWLLVRWTALVHPLLSMGVNTILLASCLAGRSLRAAAIDVLEPLQADNLEQARTHLSRYVGRDTANLPKPEVLRALLETVTENATDGVMAPLFYALLGLLIPFVGSVPFALAYKAASTLDSSIGYKTAPYTFIGWFPARLEDGLTWLPCRLTVLTIALISGQPRYVWHLCQRDAPQDPSPNAGWSECAYAAALNVQMGGLNYYRGLAKPKPLLGNPNHAITPEKVNQALKLTRFSFLLWLTFAVLIWLLVQLVNQPF
jgi:adenosylcobinamide-phosphate synthase